MPCYGPIPLGLIHTCAWGESRGESMPLRASRLRLGSLLLGLASMWGLPRVAVTLPPEPLGVRPLAGAQGLALAGVLARAGGSPKPEKEARGGALPAAEAGDGGEEHSLVWDSIFACARDTRQMFSLGPSAIPPAGGLALSQLERFSLRHCH